jgi:hypothetical protein
LVEVVVALLISSVMITAVFGVALTSKSGSGSGQRRVLANTAVSQVSAQLKAYVTACCTPTSGLCPGASSCGAAGAGTGPNSLNGVNSWAISLPSPPAATAVVDAATAPSGASCTPGATRNTWALMCGDHYLTGINSTLEAPPYCGYVKYNVSWPAGCSAGSPPSQGAPIVAFTVNWTEP